MKLNEKKRERERARGKENIHSWGSTIVEREVENLKGHTYKVATERRTTIYFPPFLGERSRGASAKLAREEQQTRGTGKCFPRACLMSIALLSRFVLAFARL